MAGRGIRTSVVGTARQVDVAPTISALLGLPIPAGSQGRALSEAFDTGPEKVLAVLQRQRLQKQAFVRAYTVSVGEPPPVQAAATEAPPDADALVRSIQAMDDQVEAARQARTSSDRRSRLPVAAGTLVAIALALLIVYVREPRTTAIAGGIGTAAWAAGVVLIEARLQTASPPNAVGCDDFAPLLTRVGAVSFACALFGSCVGLALARLWQPRLLFAARCLLGLAPISGAAYLLAMRVASAYWRQGLWTTWALGDLSLRLQSLADLARLRAVAWAALLVPALAWVAGRSGRSRAAAPLAIIALLAAAGPIEAAGAIYTDVPEQVDASKRYLFYLHGRIVELQGRKAVSPDFGPYEYDAILRALAESGFEVISEIRPPSTGPEYAKKAAAAVRRLLAAKVPPDHVTVAGFSKGGGLALATAAELGEPRVNFAIMAGCGSETDGLATRLKGRILSIYDASDTLAASCAGVLPRGTAGTSREIVLHVGRGHGTFFTPRKEWLDPLRDWALGK